MPARPRPRARPSSPAPRWCARWKTSAARSWRWPAAARARRFALPTARLRSSMMGRCAAWIETGDVLPGTGSFDPPTTPLDADGQGVPYATYAFAAQIAEIEVDLGLGTVKPLRITAAHAVGRALNPTQVEGQMHGGVAQGLGMALMEE